MLEENKRNWALKLTVLGDAAVGKTSLIRKYVTGTFTQDYQPTLGVDITIKDIILEEINSEVRLIFWDIAGQSKYELTRKMFFQGCAGTLLVYDVTRSSTFESITSKWFDDFKKYGRADGVCLLIGNKIDMNDSIKVQSENGKKLSSELNAADFIETSAKYGENVEKAFKKLVFSVLKNYGVKII
ncbi:MAG: Rab family GTPase [Promethearchaeota archaeon]